MLERMIRAARLDVSLYEEVEANSALTSQAATVVAIVAVCSGIGNAVGAAMSREGGNPVIGLIGGLVGALVGWVIWSYVTYFVGTKLFGGTASPGEMLRTIGFAQSPGVLTIVSFVPFLGGLVAFVVGIWMLIAAVVALRQALDFDTGKAILTALVGFIPYVIVFGVIASLLRIS